MLGEPGTGKVTPPTDELGPRFATRTTIIEELHTLVDSSHLLVSGLFVVVGGGFCASTAGLPSSSTEVGLF